jgi:hypothetical protein
MILDWYDGPLSGWAMCQGMPVYYEGAWCPDRGDEGGHDIFYELYALPTAARSQVEEAAALEQRRDFDVAGAARLEALLDELDRLCEGVAPTMWATMEHDAGRAIWRMMDEATYRRRRA